MEEFLRLAAGVLEHVAAKLKTPAAPPELHAECVEALETLARIMDQAADDDDEDPSMLELVALADALDPHLAKTDDDDEGA